MSVSESESAVKKVEVSADLEPKVQATKSAEVSVASVDKETPDSTTKDKKPENSTTTNGNQTAPVDGVASQNHTEDEPLPQRKPRQRDRPTVTKDNNANVTNCTNSVLMNGDIKMNGEMNGDVNGLHE